MNVLFFGADIFAVPILKALSRCKEINVRAVVTRPAKPAGRGLRPQPNPVLRLATAYRTKIIVVDKSKDWEKISSIIASSKPDYIIVAALGLIIPDNILKLLPNRFINIHPSLLPKYRGPSPIETSIINNDSQTGVSFIILTNNLDGGPVLDQYKIRISSSNAEKLSGKLSHIAAVKLPNVLKKYHTNKIKPLGQNEDQATYTHIITKNDGNVSINSKPREIIRKVRAYYPWPGVTVKIKNRTFKLIDATIRDDVLYISKIQPAGKKIISADDFRNGYGNLLTSFPKSVKLNTARKKQAKSPFNSKKG